MIEESLFTKFTKVDQVGIVVRDMDKAIEYYQSLGIGPFEPFKNLDIVERKVRGKPVPLDSIKAKIMLAKMGPVELELIEPVEGESLWKEFLETKGEGIQHLCFFVDDIDREEVKLIEKGFTVLYRSRFKNGDGGAYFDTGKVGGVLIELSQRAPEYR